MARQKVRVLGSMRPEQSAAGSIMTALLALFAPLTVRSQGLPPGEMSADRPDFTESTGTVVPGWLQVEGGVLASRTRQGNVTVRDLGMPLALVRSGVAPWLELRVANDGLQRRTLMGGGIAEIHPGFSDAGAGVKARLTRERRFLPAIAVLTVLSLPVGSRYFSSGSADLDVRLAWSRSFPRGFDATGNFSFGWRTVESHRQPQRSNNLSIGQCLPGRLRGFWEIYHVAPGNGDHTGQVFADTGLARPVGDNVQVDIAVGRSIRGPAPGWFVTAGFAVRTSRLRVSRPH